MVTHLQRWLHSSFSSNSREGIWKVIPIQDGCVPWFSFPGFHSLKGHYMDLWFYLSSSSLEMSFLARLQSVLGSCSGPAQPHFHLQGKGSIVRHAGPGCYHGTELRIASLHSRTPPLMLSKPEVPAPEEATRQSLGQLNGSWGWWGLTASLGASSEFLAPFLARTHVNGVKNNPSPLLLSANPPRPPGWSRDPEHWRPVPSALQSVPIGSAGWRNSQNPLGARRPSTACWSLDNGPTGLERKGGEGRGWEGLRQPH